MRTAGVIGGIGPESTIQYYRQVIATYRERLTDGSYPPILINSIDMTRMLALIGAGQLAEVTAYLLGEIGALARAGAAFGALSSNTPHVVFEALARASPIPLVSIVETARRAAETAGLRRVALFGTRYTMGGRFYPDAFAAAGIAVIAPQPQEQAYIHERYMGELVHGVLNAGTRVGLLELVERLQARDGIDGLVLGGTELPLILTMPEHRGLPFLDTTRLHVERIVDEILRP